MSWPSFIFTACSVCFGDPQSLQSKGLFYSICFLLAVIGTVLGALAWTAYSWARRAQKNPS